MEHNPIMLENPINLLLKLNYVWNVLERIGTEDDVKRVVHKRDVITVIVSYGPYAIHPIIARR
jgi:hypothetical protein